MEFIIVIFCVGMFTLLERKILGYIQYRKGPNKSGFLGLIQPFRDGLKLFVKEGLIPTNSNFFMYYYRPILNIILILTLWVVLPFLSVLVNFDYGFVFVLIIRSLIVIPIILSGWSSNRDYSLLGRLRCIAQRISYEVSMRFILIRCFFLVGRVRLLDFFKFQEKVWFCFILNLVIIILFVRLLAETNRSPFDLSEGESELVSGFNIEYGSGRFAYIFISEYGSILFICVFIGILFIGSNFYRYWFYLGVFFFAFLWVWVRGSLPRIRYDKLMDMAWKRFLPVSINLLIFYSRLKLLVLALTL
jgi:NADH-ubiquinone oxidoreductase chain 1